MQPISIRCPYCGHLLEYWTENKTIHCPNCKKGIPVEPCAEPLDTESQVEEEATGNEFGI